MFVFAFIPQTFSALHCFQYSNIHFAVVDETDHLDPHEVIRGTGFLGRFADELSKKGYGVNSFSVDNGFQGLEGDSLTVKKSLNSKRGIERVGDPGSFIGQQTELLNSKVEGYNSVFSDAWSSALVGTHSYILCNIIHMHLKLTAIRALSIVTSTTQETLRSSIGPIKIPM